MILIVSEKNDISTDHVIDWLTYFDIPHIRINEGTKFSIQSVLISDIGKTSEITLNFAGELGSRSINLNEILAFWYRRGGLFMERCVPDLSADDQFYDFQQELNSYLSKEISYLEVFINHYLDGIGGIGSYKDNFIDKLHTLLLASKYGLSIPATQVVTNKSDLVTFLDKHQRVITKGINANSWGKKSVIGVGCGTVEITRQALNNISDCFYPSLVQQYIDKFCEIRCFYLDGTIWATALFSQRDEMTKIDFRNYNTQRPTRMVPYKLHPDTETSVTDLMKALKMTSGVLDLIIDNSGRVFFLEVNPVGQFEFTSKPCNFYLEMQIAKNLKEKYENRRRNNLS